MVPRGASVPTRSSLPGTLGPRSPACAVRQIWNWCVLWVPKRSSTTYTQEDFTQSRERYDVIFDAVRKLPDAGRDKSLAKNGVFLSVKDSTKERSEDLVYLKELIEAGEIKPVIDRRYPLEEIAKAHRYVEKGHKVGNVVISVAG